MFSGISATPSNPTSTQLFFGVSYIPTTGKHILVIGSTTPWIGVILLAQGVSHITTQEYNPYPCNHPNMTVISKVELSKLVISNKATVFDAMVTFSSLEHSGLGRYTFPSDVVIFNNILYYNLSLVFISEKQCNQM